MSRRQRALVVALTYLALGLAWVLISDHLGGALDGSSFSEYAFQSLKGAAFVGVSALVLYLAVAAPWQSSEGDATLPESVGAPVVVTLARLVLATAVPMLLLFGWHTWRETRGQIDAAERLVRATARGVANDAALLLDSQVRLAGALARRAAQVRMDGSRCDRVLLEAAALNELLLDITLYDLAGQRVCGGTYQLHAGEPGWLSELGRLRRATVGGIERAATEGSWMVPVVQPVLGSDAGPAIGAVELLLPATALLPVIAGGLPKGGVVALIDADGNIVARHPEHQRFAGTRMPQDVWQQVRQAPPSVLRTATGLDQVRRIYVAEPVPGTRWVVTAGLPAADLYAPARQAFIRTALAGLLTLLLCIWLIVYTTRGITRPLQQVARVAQAASNGDFSQRAPLAGPSELAGVAAGLNHLLERLPALQDQLTQRERAWRERIDKLSRHVPSVVFLFKLDAQGHTSVPFVSDAVRAIFEIEPDEVVHDGTALMRRLHPEDRPSVQRAFADSARTMLPVSMSYRLQPPSGQVRHVFVVAQPERDGANGVDWYGALSDVTELHQTQSDLERLNATLEQRIAAGTAELRAANEALESFAYSVAHDLRAPLASIEGFAQATAEAIERGDAARARHFAARVSANTGRMHQLIEAFLDLARSGRESLVDGIVPVHRLVSEMLQELPRSPATHVEVGALPRVRADQATFRQVWHNLLTNAIKYSAGQAHPCVRVSCEIGEQDVVFCVADNGAGFDPAWSARLFTPFGRLHKAEEFEGTGVGLAVVRRIVERHGGRVWAQGRPGEGASFYFSLPRDRLVVDTPDMPPVTALLE